MWGNNKKQFWGRNKGWRQERWGRRHGEVWHGGRAASPTQPGVAGSDGEVTKKTLASVQLKLVAPPVSRVTSRKHRPLWDHVFEPGFEPRARRFVGPHFISRQWRRGLPRIRLRRPRCFRRGRRWRRAWSSWCSEAGRRRSSANSWWTNCGGCWRWKSGSGDDVDVGHDEGRELLNRFGAGTESWWHFNELLFPTSVFFFLFLSLPHELQGCQMSRRRKWPNLLQPSRN